MFHNNRTASYYLLKDHQSRQTRTSSAAIKRSRSAISTPRRKKSAKAGRRHPAVKRTRILTVKKRQAAPTGRRFVKRRVTTATPRKAPGVSKTKAKGKKRKPGGAAIATTAATRRRTRRTVTRPTRRRRVATARRPRRTEMPIGLL